MWAVTPLLPPNYNAMQYNKCNTMQSKKATQFGRVVAKTLRYTLWCEQFWHSGDCTVYRTVVMWGELWQGTLALLMSFDHCFGNAFAHLLCFCFCFCHLLQTCFSCNCNTTQCGTRALQYIRQTDILVVFCIQAFRKAAGFDFEIRFSFCWLQLSFNQFLKGWPELVLEFDI